MSDTGRFYTRKEALKALGVSNTFFKLLVQGGALKGVSGGRGRTLVYSEASVEKARRRLFPEGLSYIEIAHKYGIARNTVKKYVREAKLHPLGYHRRIRSYVYDPAQVADLAASLGWQENQTDEPLSPDSADATASSPLPSPPDAH